MKLLEEEEARQRELEIQADNDRLTNEIRALEEEQNQIEEKVVL